MPLYLCTAKVLCIDIVVPFPFQVVDIHAIVYFIAFVGWFRKLEIDDCFREGEESAVNLFSELEGRLRRGHAMMNNCLERKVSGWWTAGESSSAINNAKGNIAERPPTRGTTISPIDLNNSPRSLCPAVSRTVGC